MAEGSSTGLNAEDRLKLTTLMVSFADGDRSSFAEVFQLLWPQVLVVTSHLLRNQADAEDAAQTAILKVFARIVDFDRTRDGLSWALGIAAFEARTILQKTRRRREDFAEPSRELQDVQPSAEELLIEQDARLSLAAVMGSLQQHDQLALAAILDPPEARSVPLSAAARKRKQRTIERLRAAWHRLLR
jgi:RNA polymerase sigma-70 factor (ECF subfamily)